MTAMTGGCACGTVRWTMSGAPTPLAHCHCSVCRKAHGTAFATYMAAQPEDFRFDAGADAITWYESSPGFQRAFCRRCGAMVPGVAQDGHIFIPATSFDQDPGVRPKIHLFVTSRAPWHDITDALRQFDAFPRKDGPALLAARAADRQWSESQLSGSCNCAGVAFEVTSALQSVQHCHCSRCQRTRAAVHATNGFVAAEHVRFVRGESLLEEYHVDGAAFFAQTFCSACGSAMPRRCPERHLAVIPFGSLDGPPDHWPWRRPERHIYVADKVAWHDITDSLPQLDAQ